MSPNMRFPTMWYVRQAKSQISLRICAAFASRLNKSMTVKLLTEHHLEFLSLKGGCTGSFESALVKMPHGWKSCHGSNYFDSVSGECFKTLWFSGFSTHFDQVCYPTCTCIC